MLSSAIDHPLSYSSLMCNFHSSSLSGELKMLLDRRNMNILYLTLKNRKNKNLKPEMKTWAWKRIKNCVKYDLQAHEEDIEFYAQAGLIKWHSSFVTFQQSWTINYQKYLTPLLGDRFSQCKYPNYTRIRSLFLDRWMCNISESRSLCYAVLHLSRLLTTFQKKYIHKKVALRQ